jgi:hypothetical protein
VERSHLNKSRLIVGIVLIAIAALMFLFSSDYSTAGAIAIGVLGLVSVAISRRK